MTGGSTAESAARTETLPAEPPALAESLVIDDPMAEALPAHTHGAPAAWIAPLVAIIAGVGATYGMASLAMPAWYEPLSDFQRVQLLASVCIPGAVVALLYLIAVRTSTSEARRFADTARTMREEAEHLEMRTATLTDRLVAQRHALAEQETSLSVLSDAAAERLANAAASASRQAETIVASTQRLSAVTSGAEQSVAVILSSLPRAHDEMRGLAERVDAAGLQAAQAAAALDIQLSVLADRGREADRIAGGAAERLAAHISRMEATSEAASSRLEQVTDQMSAQVDAVLDRAAAAVDQSRQGIAAQGDAMLAMLGANQAALERASEDSSALMAQRMAMIEDAIIRISARLSEEQRRSDALFARLSDGATAFDQELEVLHAAGTRRTEALASAIHGLHQSMDGMTESMRTGETTARGVIATGEELLTALDAAARELDETMPGALERLDARIDATRKRIAASKPELLGLVTAAEATHDAVEGIASSVTRQQAALERGRAALAETLATAAEQAETLSRAVDGAIEHANSFTREAAPELLETLLRVRDSANKAADHAREAIDGIVPAVDRVLQDATDTAIERAVEISVRQQVDTLSRAADAAIGAAARAAEHLRAQMTVLEDANRLAEARIAEAQDAQERAESDGFAHRMALLIDALHSTSIDIAKTFSTEVTDGAWGAYLKGDRGVFTRRAVRLLAPHEAREIHRLYEHDDTFRDNVHRYVHDFETMLRQVLGLREGNPLAVTLLSSDAGKLYVALAQAIERLRS
ncbi:hypothetical protein [Sphingomonas sp. TDK1]|uniref:hypothetical protein n=1 Tax=Sphingomonas sp. TDK1 TaxID=453247 RepID=UPI0007D981F0|nr:hypothetical protein [Sphingomonas sp. TDK1]OAN62729.1 hypothetical protein A7X12_21340 [Sphingomonas sp. TDK1]